VARAVAARRDLLRVFLVEIEDEQQDCVAYFSMEFMLSEALPIYSGGLGNVAGDQLKAASDLGVPVIGVGPALPAGLFPSGDRSGRIAAGALSL
jgi:starch phosphorylase